MLETRTLPSRSPQIVSLRPLAIAVALFAVLMGVVALANDGFGGRHRGEALAPVEIVDLTLEPDGYAVLRGIAFPVEELAMQVAQLQGERGMPAVRVKVPRDLDLKVLLTVMGVLKGASVPQTSVDVLPES